MSVGDPVETLPEACLAAWARAVGDRRGMWSFLVRQRPARVRRGPRGNRVGWARSLTVLYRARRRATRVAVEMGGVKVDRQRHLRSRRAVGRPPRHREHLPEGSLTRRHATAAAAVVLEEAHSACRASRHVRKPLTTQWKCHTPPLVRLAPPASSELCCRSRRDGSTVAPMYDRFPDTIQ